MTVQSGSSSSWQTAKETCDAAFTWSWNCVFWQKCIKKRCWIATSNPIREMDAGYTQEIQYEHNGGFAVVRMTMPYLAFSY